MIRINLLTVDRTPAKKKLTIQTGQKLTVGCTLILVLAGSFIGWRYLTVTQQASQLDGDIAAAQQETVRLRSIIQQVQEFEQRKTQLSQRVVLIEDLRKAQTGPVHMLDQISRSLPPMLWLTMVRQVDGAVTIEGNSTTQTGVSDFVTNLEGSGYFRKSIDIVGTATQPMPQPPGELVRFTLRAQFERPGEVAPQPPPGAKPGARPGRK
jgi:type IV pilus assembly protein PilN